MDIAALNKVNMLNAVMPNYRPEPMNRRIDLYLTLDGKALISGAADNNYIYWLSLTSADDRVTNAAIFDYIANCNYETLASLYKVLPDTGLMYEQLKETYHTYLCKSNEPNTEWKTPFGHYYGSDQIKNNGKFFADDLASLPGKLKRQCEARGAGGIYIRVLEKYLELLKNKTGDSVNDYYTAKPIIDIIEKENYLIFSQNADVRRLYGDLRDLFGGLYNAYMTQVR